MDVLARLNRFTTPDDVAAGANFITLDRSELTQHQLVVAQY